jgi:hypothetical protein
VAADVAAPATEFDEALAAAAWVWLEDVEPTMEVDMMCCVSFALLCSYPFC